MRWMRFRVRTTAEAEDIIISSMQDIGLYGAQIEDHVPLTAKEKEQMFVDILPEAPEDDGTAVLSFFVEKQDDGTLKLEDGSVRTPDEICASMETVLAELRQRCSFIGDGAILADETEDTDWINNWKQYFHQFRIDDILCIPSWETPQAEEGEEPALVFHIDPGTAFGTGMHETTQLCVRQIRRFLTPGTRLLDIGTGSGILGILSLMLGAGHVVGTDLDPCSVPAVQDNLAANGVDPAAFEMILGNLVDDLAVQERVGFAQYDIVAANILPSVLVPLMPAAVRAMKPGAVCITSGIIEGSEAQVAAAMQAAGLELLDITAQGEWRCVTGRRGNGAA